MTTEYLLNAEVDKVLGCMMPVNRLVCETMLQTGLRIGDVVQLKKSQIARQFWITEGKTGKRRRVNMPDWLVHELNKTRGVWAFPGRDFHNHITRQAVWKDVKRAAKAYRLPQNVGTHSMRKVFAVDLLNKYGDIEKVKRALCHSSSAVTLIYAMADKRLQLKLKRRKAKKMS